MAPAKSRNLILVHHPDGQARLDLEEISGRIASLDPAIDVQIVPHDAAADTIGWPADFWARPTLTVSFRWSTVFRPKRGPLLSGHPLNKLQQLKRFHEAGVPVPPTVAYEVGRPLRRDFWGELVILKPSVVALKSGGRHTFLVRTEHVAEISARLFPADHPARKAPLLVQRFVDTGDYPANYRVLCLFGEPLLCMQYQLKQPRPPLDAPEDALLAAPIASNTDGMHRNALVAPPAVLAFARQVAAAMPRIPLQGIDIVNECGTGKLFALENNPGGNTWHFSSRIAEEGRREISREQRIAQFGAWDIAARVLVERTAKDAQ